MKIRKYFGSSIASCLAILMMLPVGDPIAATAQSSSTTQNQPGPAAAPPSQQPDATKSNANDQSYPDAPSPSSSQSNEVPASADQQNGETKPLGTAAAPYTKPSGVMGSRPAGAVIAPAKQRRVHAILISVGIVVGAGIAIGTVAALSKGSPSRP